MTPENIANIGRVEALFLEHPGLPARLRKLLPQGYPGSLPVFPLATLTLALRTNFEDLSELFDLGLLLKVGVAPKPRVAYSRTLDVGDTIRTLSLSPYGAAWLAAIDSAMAHAGAPVTLLSREDVSEKSTSRRFKHLRRTNLSPYIHGAAVLLVETSAMNQENQT